MKSVLVLQHAECEAPGLIARALEESGFHAKLVKIFSGDASPKELGAGSGLVIMGGPMSVYEHERFPFLRDELRLIEDAMRQGKPVLGVCLGSQLLATTLGSTVRRGKQKEIGWHPVSFYPPASQDALCKGLAGPLMAYHWHGDIFDLPAGCTHLASSRRTACQAFRNGGNVYGFLFHAEVTGEILDGMTARFADELAAEGLDRDETLRQAGEYLPPLQTAGLAIFRRWAALLEEP